MTLCGTCAARVFRGPDGTFSCPRCQPPAQFTPPTVPSAVAEQDLLDELEAELGPGDEEERRPWPNLERLKLRVAAEVLSRAPEAIVDLLILDGDEDGTRYLSGRAQHVSPDRRGSALLRRHTSELASDPPADGCAAIERDLVAGLLPEGM